MGDEWHFGDLYRKIGELDAHVDELSCLMKAKDQRKAELEAENESQYGEIVKLQAEVERYRSGNPGFDEQLRRLEFQLKEVSCQHAEAVLREQQLQAEVERLGEDIIDIGASEVNEQHKANTLADELRRQDRSARKRG